MLTESTYRCLLGLSLIISQTLAQICYNGQGVQDPKLFPCNADGGCCRAGDYCWSNGFCGVSDIGTGGASFFFGCTDSSWDLDGCAGQCRNVTTGNGMKSCPGGVVDGTSPYCCLGYDTDCDCSASAVRVATGTIVTSLSSGYTTGGSSATSSSSISQTTDSATTSDASSNNSATSSSAASGANNAASSSSSLSTGARIGIGVGVGVGGALLLGALAVFILRRRHARSTARHRTELDHSGAEKRPLHEMRGVNLRGHEMHSNSINWRTANGPVEAPQ